MLVGYCSSVVPAAFEHAFANYLFCSVLLIIIYEIYAMLCTIWYHLYNLKNLKNTHGGMLLLLK